MYGTIVPKHDRECMVLLYLIMIMHLTVVNSKINHLSNFIFDGHTLVFPSFVEFYGFFFFCLT